MRYRADLAINEKRNEMEDRQIRHMVDASYGINGQKLKVSNCKPNQQYIPVFESFYQELRFSERVFGLFRKTNK